MARIELDSTAIRQLAAEPEMVEAFGELAARGAERARSIAPKDRGTFEDSIASESGVEDGWATGRVFTDDPIAVYLEFGTGGTSPTPAFHTLLRSMDAMRE